MTASIDLSRVLAALGPQLERDAAGRDETDTFVSEAYDRLREYKVFSALVPAELGGGGASHSEMCDFVRRLAHFCGSTALALSMHQHLVAAAVLNHRAGRPGRKLLEKVAGSEAVLVSTGANDWMESSGVVERADGGFRVTARKPFCSGAPKGAVLVTSAPYEDPEAGWQVLHFPVPFAAEGVSIADDWRTLGMRATGSHTVVLDRVFVPEEAVALRRPRGAYHPAWNVILTVAMPLIMSAYLGVAEAAATIAGQQARKRAGDPATLYLLGELTNHLTTARPAVADMVRIANDLDVEPTLDTADAVLVRKTIAAKAVLRTAEKALEASGGAGFYRPLGLERLLRDAHGAQFHPLPEKRQVLFTGRVALGQDPIGSASGAVVRMAAE